MICRPENPLPQAALALLFACSAAGAQEIGRRRVEPAPRAGAAPVVFLDSTRERDGLKGPVRRVETEVLKVEQRDGRLVEKSRSVLERTLYDERGRRAENETYPVVSNPAGREFHGYDAQGNLAETVVRDARGAVLSRTVYRYEFDAYGNWVKMTASVAVVSAGRASYEPFEITNRAITYYATEEPAAKTDDARAAVSKSDTTPKPNATTKSDAATERKGEAAHVEGGTAREAGEAAHAGDTAARARGEEARATGNTRREGARVAHAGGREIEVGVLNDRATSLSRPAFPVTGKRLDRPINVSVEVVVDQTGLVVEANAQDAPPALRRAAEDAARRATFFPFYSEGRPVRARGRLNFGFYFAP